MSTLQDCQTGTIAVLGGGALGSLVAARLAAGGGGPVVVSRPSPHLVEAARRGIVVSELDGSARTVPVRVATDPGAVATATVLLVCVKTWATADALAPLAPFLPPDALAGLNLNADQLGQVKELGIQSLNVQTKPEGLAVTLNGNALPLLRWDSGQIDNLVKLGLQGGVLTAITDADAESLDALNQIGKFAPLLATTPLNITVSFPE